MKKGPWLALPILAILVLWAITTGRTESIRSNIKSALGLATAPTPKESKPICAENIAPVGDCIPKYLANLPPDPGPEGEKTLEGIDADKDGVRDDVQRFIAVHYGESERALRALTNIAKSNQLKVAMGDSISREEAQKLAPVMLNAGRCYARTVDPKYSMALERVAAQVLNTPERLVRAKKFEYLLAHNIYPFPDVPAAEVCGYEPASLPN